MEASEDAALDSAERAIQKALDELREKRSASPEEKKSVVKTLRKIANLLQTAANLLESD